MNAGTVKFSAGSEKKATLVWIPKKDGSPRPISLVPTLGKVLDKVLNRRLQYHLEKEGMIDVNQYAYKQGMGRIDALRIYRKIFQENTRGSIS